GTAIFNHGSQVSAVNGDVSVTAAGSISLNGSASLSVTGSGNVTLTTDDVAVAATSQISASDGTANGNNVLTIRNFTTGRAINLGTDAGLALTDAELDRITAEMLRIGRNDASASGPIAISAAIDLT